MSVPTNTILLPSSDTLGLLYNASSIRRAASPFDDYDLKYHRLELNATPNRFWIEGKVTSYFTFTKQTNIITFHLRNHLQVDSIQQRGNNIPYTHENGIITITFPATYSVGYLDSVSVYYSGNATQGNNRAFYITAHNTGKLLATLSEPYGASDWWPCKEYLNDKFDSCDVIITTDTGYLVGGPGLLVANYNLNDSQQVFHWQHRYPCNFYLIGIAISNFKEIKDSVLLHGVQMPIIHYVYPQSYNSIVNEVKNTPPIVHVFDSLFGTYPYIKEKYGHMQWNTTGGMEHATMSSMGAFNFDLVAHEAAHQWFGNKVTCNTWQDIWLNESFATYLNGLAYELLLGNDTFYSKMGETLQKAKKNNSLSIFVEDTANVGRIFNQDLSYNKGAMVLHTLRYYMGDSAFFLACRNYLNDPLLAYNSAGNSQLMAHFQALSQNNLTPFFSAFYYGIHLSGGFRINPSNKRLAVNILPITVHIGNKEFAEISTKIEFDLKF